MKNVECILGEYENSSHWLKEYRLRRCLKKIPDELIINQIGMAEMPKVVYVLKKKYNRNIKLIPIENDVMLRIGKINVANMSYLAVYLHFLTISGQNIHIEGNISVPDGLAGCSFYAKVNGRKKEVQLYDCGLDLKLGDEIYEKRTVFSIDIHLAEQLYIVDFYNIASGTECRCARINSLRFAPIADGLKGQYCAFGDWVVRISGNKIVCCKSNVLERAAYEDKYQREISLLLKGKADWVIALRKKYFEAIKKQKSPIWLIMDRSDRADDNGEVFFRYMQRHKDVDTYYVIDRQSRDYGRLQEIGKVLPLYSEEHYLAALLAECVISSQCNGYVENPFWENAEYFRDLYHKPKLVFLQHGVIKDDMSLTLNRFHTNFKGFVTSTEAEYQSILNYPYYYGKENVWLTGLPIFDELENHEQGYIVIAPTWRKGLMHQEWSREKKEMCWVPNADMKLSEYYRTFRRLLLNQKLREQCIKHGYRLAFKPHPLMEPYVGEIVAGTDVMLMGAEVSYRDMIAMGNLLVTDYSSIAFEFAYLGKGTLYFQFDRESFFSTHTYKKGYFDYEKDGFGEVCDNQEELIKLLVGYMGNGCVVKNKYRQRILQLYPYRGDVCERLYELIKQVALAE